MANEKSVVYFWETIGFKMPADRSVDIDCEYDFKLSELLQKI